MRYSPEEIFKKFINSVLSDASLDFFVKRAAVFLSMMMPFPPCSFSDQWKVPLQNWPNVTKHPPSISATTSPFLRKA